MTLTAFFLLATFLVAIVAIFINSLVEATDPTRPYQE